MRFRATLLERVDIFYKTGHIGLFCYRKGENEFRSFESPGGTTNEHYVHINGHITDEYDRYTTGFRFFKWDFDKILAEIGGS